MATKGFWIQNDTADTINVQTIDKKVTFWLRPKGEDGEIGWIPAEYSDDPIVKRLIDRHMVSKSTDGEAKAKDEAKAEVKAKSDAAVAELSVVEDKSGEDMVKVPCAATTKQGTQCKNFAYVTVDAAKAGPSFCVKHENEDKSKYELVDDVWVLKS